MASITLKGEPVQTLGELPEIGTKAPEFSLVDKQLNDLALEDFGRRWKILNIVPSLDTPVCAQSAREFNRRAGQLAQAALLVISADLPFAQGRFCATEGMTGLTTLSMMRSKAFAKDYGVLIENGPLAGLTARAVLILNEENQVVYRELVTEITREPDYDSALAVLGH